MKRYFMSVDLNQAGIEAKDKAEAISEAIRQIKEDAYSIEIVDCEDIQND